MFVDDVPLLSKWWPYYNKYFNEQLRSLNKKILKYGFYELLPGLEISKYDRNRIVLKYIINDHLVLIIGPTYNESKGKLKHKVFIDGSDKECLTLKQQYKVLYEIFKQLSQHYNVH